MLNPSDPNPASRAIPADDAQLLRGGGAFGAVAFYDGGPLGPEHVYADPGYADCLPIRGGGVWRDPAKAKHTESDR